ncbi:hypothetical protein [Treponema sp.]|uniref:hypothetical protein n=1 Tax=Treponema sp. TaxID=166 RepID=UPI003F006A7C
MENSKLLWERKMKPRFILKTLILTAVFAVLPGTLNSQETSGFLPDTIFFRTMTQSYCKYFEFTLVDGRIYAKKPEEKKWKLFLKTGLPVPQINTTGAEEFPVPERITEISADGDSLYVFDSSGILYSVFLCKDSPETPFVWKKEFGFPKSGNGFLKQDEFTRDKRAWSMGCRRKDVLYHSDIYGNEHHYGTMGLETIYFLTADGQHIRFTDSGLPADFSRQIQVPENGRFISENLSASADTIFLIGAKGTMYTRLIDFDTMGCDPMWFQYTYNKLEQKKKGKSYFSNYSPWALPAEDWLKQPAIPIEGNARLSKIISIAQNGHGNGARVLRVAGTNSSGATGFYEKNIFDSAWNFYEAEIFIDEKDFLDSSKPEIGSEAEFSYTGNLVLNDSAKKDLTCILKGVSLMSEDKCILEISDGTQTFSCTLFTVEKWAYPKRKNPGFDGTPRNYFITAEFDEASIENYTGELRKTIEAIFKNKNHSLFAFTGSGTEEYFEISSNSKPKHLLKNPFAQKTANFNFILSRDGIENPPKISAFALPLLKDFKNSEFLLEPGKTYSIKERSLVQEKIDRNKEYRDFITSDLEQFEELKKNARHTRWGYSALDFITTITFLNKINFPKIKQLSTYGADLFATNFSSFEELTEYRNFVYERVLELIDLRLERYEKIIQDFDNNEVYSTLSADLKNSFTEYFDLVALPKDAKMNCGNTEITLEQFNDISYLPAYYLKTSSGTTATVVLQNAANSILLFFESGKNLEETPLIFKAEFTVSEISENDLKEIKAMKKLQDKTGTVEWNGKTLKIFAGKKLLFEAGI